MLVSREEKYFLVLKDGKLSMSPKRPGKEFSIVDLRRFQKLAVSNSVQLVYTLVWQLFNYVETEIEGSGQYVFTGVVYDEFNLFKICKAEKGTGFASHYQAMDILGLDDKLMVDIAT